MRTCGGGILGLEQAHHALAVEAPGAEQHCLGARVFPTHDRQPVVPVAARHFVQAAVLHCLRNHQQPRVAEGDTGMEFKSKTDRNWTKFKDQIYSECSSSGFMLKSL